MADNRLVLFDCDGTLADGQHMIIDAMHHAFDEHDLPRAPADRVREVIGLSLVEAMHKLLPEEDRGFHDQLAATYKASFARLHASGQFEAEPLYEGTAETLRALDDQGYLLGVATGKSTRGLRRVLEQHDLQYLFVTLQTADTNPSKPHPAMVQKAMAEAGSSPDTTIMIGDTSYDMMMGQAAGCHTIGVDWGYHDSAELERTGARHLIGDWKELLPLAQTLFMRQTHGS